MRVLLVLTILLAGFTAGPVWACRIPVAVRGVFEAEPYALPEGATLYTGRVVIAGRDDGERISDGARADGYRTFVGLLERPGRPPVRLYASMTSCHAFRSFTPTDPNRVVHVVGFLLPSDARGERLAIYSRWPGGDWFDLDPRDLEGE